jgi:hypothetical protein
MTCVVAGQGQDRAGSAAALAFGWIGWKILSTGYRGRLTELPSVIHMVTNLEFYRQAT